LCWFGLGTLSFFGLFFALEYEWLDHSIDVCEVRFLLIYSDQLYGKSEVRTTSCPIWAMNCLRRQGSLGRAQLHLMGFHHFMRVAGLACYNLLSINPSFGLAQVRRARSKTPAKYPSPRSLWQDWMEIQTGHRQAENWWVIG
jgi:hypothetical protein